MGVAHLAQWKVCSRSNWWGRLWKEHFSGLSFIFYGLLKLLSQILKSLIYVFYAKEIVRLLIANVRTCSPNIVLDWENERLLNSCFIFWRKIRPYLYIYSHVCNWKMNIKCYVLCTHCNYNMALPNHRINTIVSKAIKSTILK